MHEHFGYICNGCEFFLWALKIDYSCPRLDCGHNVITQNFCLTSDHFTLVQNTVYASACQRARFLTEHPFAAGFSVNLARSVTLWSLAGQRLSVAVA